MKKHYFIAFIFLFCLFLSPQIAEAKVFSKQLIKNSGFENIENFNDNWNCEIGYNYYTYQCPIFTQFDEEQKSGEYYFTLGAATDSKSSLHTSIHQIVTIPQDADKARLSFDYQWRTVKKNDPGKDSFHVVVWSAEINPEVMNEDMIEVVYIFDDEQQKEWKHVSVDVSKFKGEKVKIFFGVGNKDYNPSTARLDNVKLRVATKSNYTGTVTNSQGKIVKNATVKIKNKKGKILWQGKTNTKGKFKATDLKGSTIKKRFSITKNNQTYKFTRRIKCGKAYNKEFTLE